VIHHKTRALSSPLPITSPSIFRCSYNGDSNGNAFAQAAEAERQRKIREEEQRKVR
jgi:hypothetical protein